MLNIKVILIKNTIKIYFDKISPDLKDINSFKKFDTWSIQSTLAMSFMFAKDTDVECVMHAKSDSVEIAIHDQTDEVIEEYFE